MDTNDAHDPVATPEPGADAGPDPVQDPTLASPEQPLLIVPATEPPGLPDDLAPTVSSPTEVIPVVPAVQPAVQPGVVHETYAPAYVPPDVPYVEGRRPAWPYVVAVVAVLLGGLVGYVIGAVAGDDGDETAAPATTGAPGSTVATATTGAESATDNTAVDDAEATEELQAQVELLTAAREEATGLADRVAVLEAALADVTLERDALLIAAGTDDSTTADVQAELDAANAAIDEITGDLTEANTDLEAANAIIVERDSAIDTLEDQLDTANATLEDLDVTTVPSYVNGAVAKARTDAAANGWILIEQPTVSATSPAGVVLDQAPPANSNMVNGSVLYVEVATRS